MLSPLPLRPRNCFCSVTDSILHGPGFSETTVPNIKPPPCLPGGVQGTHPRTVGRGGQASKHLPFQLLQWAENWQQKTTSMAHYSERLSSLLTTSIEPKIPNQLLDQNF